LDACGQAGYDWRQRWIELKMPAAAVILTISPGRNGAMAIVQVAAALVWRR